MCGIAGFAGGEPAAGDAQVAAAMAAAVRHRGPDDQEERPLRGDGGAVRGWFAHRRLRIIDLGPAAAQPMERDGVVLTYNGEVYNFRELRAELQRRGHRFASHGDTEVVLCAYLEWGAAFVERIDGMFALAIWDGRDESLLLARDRVGKKPLYLHRAPAGRLSFGSEIKALLAAPWVPATPDLAQVPEYLALGYVPEPATFYEGIEAVPPAHVTTWRGGTARSERYWSPPAARPAARREEVAARARELVRAAVRRRMVADVPLGAFLSGGIDSAVVVALMAEASEAPVRTFSAGFAGAPTYDERAAARELAACFGTQHTEFTVAPDAAALLDKLIWHHDQPFGDSSAIPTFLVAEQAREHVTVALTGDGGDEVFAGYDRFRAARIARWIPAVALSAAERGGRLISRTESYHDLRARLERFTAGGRRSVVERYVDWVAVADRDFVHGLTGNGTPPLPPSMARELEASRGADDLERILQLNFATYLPGDLLPKTDRTSMASSLEVRCPLLDTAVVELMATVPAAMKIGLRRPKPLMRAAFAGLVPDSVWTRPKHGFGVPVGQWFRGELRPLFEDEVLAADARSAGILDRANLRAAWEEHQAAAADHGHRLWTLLTLERWLRSLA